MKSTLKTIPHGRMAFAERQSCDCKPCQAYRDAVRGLVESFSQIPSRWIETVSQHHHQWLPLPMWGTLFVPTDGADRSGMERLLRPLEAQDDDELAALSDAGWREIADTGVLAVEFDDELLLGIHGAGYSFYCEHWAPLYDALAYSWHE